MGIESLYADSIEAGIQRQIANPLPEPGTSFSTRAFLAAGMKGIPRGGLEVGGSVMDLLRPAAIESLRHPTPWTANQPDASERRSNDLQTFGGGGDPARAKAAEFAPDPMTATTADQVLHGFTRVATKVVAATAVSPTLPGAALLLGAEGTNTAYRENIAKGMDATTALQVAGVEGIGQAASVIPFAGPTIKSTIGLGVAAGPGAYMAQEAVARKILEQAGYKDEASRHDPLDPLGLTIATLMPTVFGGAHAIGLARAAKPPPTLAQVVLGNESGGKRYGADGQLLTSPKGAQGEMQVMPGTATDPGYGVTPARDTSPDELARVGRDYLDAMVHRYGSADQAMAAYNAGPGAVDKALQFGPDWLKHLPQETQDYVAKGMKKLGDGTVAHAATDPAAVDAARVRTTQDALHHSLPDVPEAAGQVMDASDSIAAGHMPEVRPLTDYSDYFADMEPKYDVPRESQAVMRMDERGQPEIIGNGIHLTDAHPTERIEHIQENPGDQLTRFAVRDAQGNIVGHTDLLLNGSKVVSLYDIEMNPALRKQGTGAKVVEAITSLEPDRKIGISNVVDEAVPFWEKVGAQVSDGNRSPTLDWHQFAESASGRSRGATRRSASVARNAEAVDAAGGAGGERVPSGGIARELSPEEAAAFGFDKFHGEATPSPYAAAVQELGAALKGKDPGQVLAELKGSGKLTNLANNALVGAADAGGNAARLKALVQHAEEIARNNPATDPGDVMAAAVERVRNGQPVTKPSEAEAAAKTDRARIDAMHAEQPDMRVILPGHEQPMTLTDAMAFAQRESDFIRSESDLVQAAVACALAAGGA